jgi:hypothetical protein
VTSDVRTRVEIMRDTQTEMRKTFFRLQYALVLFVSVCYYFIAFIFLPVVSFMNFSLLYPSFLHTLVTSNGRLCYYLPLSHVPVRYLRHHLDPLAIIVIYVIHVVTGIVTISIVIHHLWS